MTRDRDQIRLQRLRKNELTFRDHNNRRVAFEERAVGSDEPVPFVCECGDGACIEGGERFWVVEKLAVGAGAVP